MQCMHVSGITLALYAQFDAPVTTELYMWIHYMLCDESMTQDMHVSIKVFVKLLSYYLTLPIPWCT